MTRRRGRPLPPGAVPALACLVLLLPAAASSQSSLVLEQRLAAAAPASGAQLGLAVATDGVTLAAGAPGEAAGAGTVHLFTRRGGGWSPDEPAPHARGGAAGDQLGFAVALDGDRLAAGAPGADSRRGAVLLFERAAPGAPWGAGRRLIAPGLAPGDLFGTALALAGDELVVGAFGREGGRGAVYRFRLGGGGAPQLLETLTPPDGAAGGGFGRAVARAGDVLAVGAYLHPERGAQAGAVYFYERRPGAAGGPAPVRRSGADTVSFDGFGFALALTGDGETAAVGAPGRDAGGADAGAVYLFERAGGAWSPLGPVHRGAPGQQLGYALAVDRGRLVAGARRAGGNRGAVFLLALGAGGLGAPVVLDAGGLPRPGDQLGIAVAAAAGRVAAGAHLTGPPGAAGAGAVYVFAAAQRADLVVAVEAPAAAVPGAELEYTFTVTDRGPDAAAGARVDHPVPEGMTDLAWSCTRADGSFCGAGAGAVAERVDLAAGETLRYGLRGRVDPVRRGRLAGTVSVTAPVDRDDPVPDNDRGAFGLDLTPLADVALGLSSRPQPPLPGEPVTYRLEVVNAGPSAALGVRVEDLPPPAEFEAPAWSCTAGPCGEGGAGGLVDVIDLPPGSAAVYAVTARVSPAVVDRVGSTACATVAERPGGPREICTTDADEVVAVTDLVLAFESGPEALAPGEAGEYNLRLTNAGRRGVLAILDAGTAAGEIAVEASACPEASPGSACGEPVIDRGALRVTGIRLLAGGHARFRLVARLDPAFEPAAVSPPLASLPLTAAASPPAGVGELNEADNRDRRDTRVAAPRIALSVVLDGPAAARPRDLAAYEVTVANAGPSLARPQTVRFTVAPPGALSGLRWSCTAGAGSACGGRGEAEDAAVRIAPGGAVAYRLTGRVERRRAGRISVVAEAVAGDRVAAAGTTTRVILPPGVTGTKQLLTAGAGGPGQDVVAYEIFLHNGGPVPELANPEVELQDELPPGLVLAGARCLGGAGLGRHCDRGTLDADLEAQRVTWQGRLPHRQVAALLIEAQIAPQVEQGEILLNQGTILFDSDRDGLLDAVALTDDPVTSEPDDPTRLVVRVPAAVDIPVASPAGLVLLALLLAAAALVALRLALRRRG